MNRYDMITRYVKFWVYPKNDDERDRAIKTLANLVEVCELRARREERSGVAHIPILPQSEELKV